MKGKIMPNSTQNFDIVFSSEIQSEFNDHDIFVDIRGSKRIRLGLTGTSVFPDIEMSPRVLSFGEVTYGS